MKVFITLYAYGGIQAACLRSHVDVAFEIASKNRAVVYQTVREDALISRSRSRAAALFLESDADVWLQLDHDIEFDAGEMFDLCEKALEKESAVCVPYSFRGPKRMPSLRQDPDHSITTVGKDEIKPIMFFASGCVAIPMESLLKTLDICTRENTPPEFKVHWCVDTGECKVTRFPSLFKPMCIELENGDTEYLSEDYSCSARMTLAGVPQLAWLKPQLKHWGECAFTLPTE